MDALNFGNLKVRTLSALRPVYSSGLDDASMRMARFEELKTIHLRAKSEMRKFPYDMKILRAIPVGAMSTRIHPGLLALSSFVLARRSERSG